LVVVRDVRNVLLGDIILTGLAYQVAREEGRALTSRHDVLGPEDRDILRSKKKGGSESFSNLAVALSVILFENRGNKITFTKCIKEQIIIICR
jgi:hypothetical protein